jgi:rod shape-determining protein MreB and related proteins
MLNFLVQTLYVQISPELVTVRNAKTGTFMSEVPEIAMAHDHPKPRMLSLGQEARVHQSVPYVKIINPFAHPRSLVSDFSLGEQLLKAFVRRIVGTSIFAASSKLVMHLLGEPAGGFTQVEVRAFREMALGAGASEVVVWQGQHLSDQDLLSGTFPSEGHVLA